VKEQKMVEDEIFFGPIQLNKFFFFYEIKKIYW
jgi:hypothetical protein